MDAPGARVGHKQGPINGTNRLTRSSSSLRSAITVSNGGASAKKHLPHVLAVAPNLRNMERPEGIPEGFRAWAKSYRAAASRKKSPCAPQTLASMPNSFNCKLAVLGRYKRASFVVGLPRFGGMKLARELGAQAHMGSRNSLREGV